MVMSSIIFLMVSNRRNKSNKEIQNQNNRLNICNDNCSHGTVVFKGKLDGRPVAIKRMLKSFYHLAQREIRLLISSDGHPNVVRYFAKEEHGEFIYLSLELCVKTLADAIEEEQVKYFIL